MTDRRATDLSYGHLGEATYDTGLRTWIFSRITAADRPVQVIQPLQTCIPPRAAGPAEAAPSRSRVWAAPVQWLRKGPPELEAGLSILSPLGRSESALSTLREPRPSALLAVGQAADLVHTSGSHSVRILALPCGESGNILRLLKPQKLSLQWGDHKGIRLRTVDPASSEEGYWLGGGGAIQQITFASDLEGPTSWLAVRKAEATFILRPIYHPLAVPSTVPKAFATRLLPSRLNANEVLTLSINKTGSRPHTDVNFNPWYVRQFGVVDQGGYWSLWYIEGQARKRRTFEPVAEKFGHIYDQYTFGQGVERPNDADHWGRILWAGSVSTVVVCNRHHLAVFDLTSNPRRLPGPEIVTKKTAGLILEVKRSSTNLKHLFVLTASHLFWLEITPAPARADDENTGAKILLSCRHYREGESDSLRLELIGEEEVCIALLYSVSSMLVNTYRFSTSVEDRTTYHCASDSFVLHKDSEHGGVAQNTVQDLTVVPASLVRNHRHGVVSGPGSKYYEGVQFYQLMGLNSGYGLSKALCATILPSELPEEQSLKGVRIEAPTVKINPSSKVKSSYHIGEDFIVPNGLEDPEDYVGMTGHIPRKRFNKTSIVNANRIVGTQSQSFNARRVFEIAFPNQNAQYSGRGTMGDCIHNIAQGLADRWDHEVQGSSTALELSGFTTFSEDIDEAAASLRQILDNFGQTEDVDFPLSFTLTTVKPTLLTTSDGNSLEERRDLSQLYDKLIESWVTCLPHKVPGPSRIAKERLIRTIAAELCLSSQVMSLRDKSARIVKPQEPEEEDQLPIHDRLNIEYSSQPSKFDSQTTLGDLPSFSQGLLTPAQTPSAAPSEASHDGSTFSGEGPADAAIARLRDYAVSIKDQRPLGSTGNAVLRHWPSMPGSDPWKYSWEATNGALGKDIDDISDEEEQARRRKQEKRRRARTEKYLKKQRPVAEAPLSSQIIPTSFTSDPVGPPSSSQIPGVGISMSQPVTGVFGSRNASKNSLKKRRRTKGF